jgi:Fe2+ or Zn2+ uptake regulation protein
MGDEERIMAARKVSNDLPGTIAAMVTKGMTITDIHARLSASGADVSRATVGRIVAKVRKGGTFSKTTLAEPYQSIVPLPHGHADDIIMELKGIIPELTKQIKRALRDEESSSANSLLSALKRTTDQILQLQPPAPPDPNDQPDMIAAARMARDKLREYVERAALGK